MGHNTFKKCAIVVEDRTLVRVEDGQICVEGKDFYSDLRDLKSIIELLSDIVRSASDVARPQLVSIEGEKNASSKTGRHKNCHTKIQSAF